MEEFLKKEEDFSKRIDNLSNDKEKQNHIINFYNYSNNFYNYSNNFYKKMITTYHNIIYRKGLSKENQNLLRVLFKLIHAYKENYNESNWKGLKYIISNKSRINDKGIAYLKSLFNFSQTYKEMMFEIGHRNIVIYNVETEEYFKIEPHGAYVADGESWFENEKFDEEFENKMTEINPKISAFKLTNSCPNFGPQSKEGGSTCILWSLFILEHILKNPEMPLKELYQNMDNEYNKMNSNELKTIISKYNTYLLEEWRKMDEKKDTGNGFEMNNKILQ